MMSFMGRALAALASAGLLAAVVGLLFKDADVMGTPAWLIGASFGVFIWARFSAWVTRQDVELTQVLMMSWLIHLCLMMTAAFSLVSLWPQQRKIR